MFLSRFGVRLSLFVLANIMVMSGLMMMMCGCVVMSGRLMMVLASRVLCHVAIPPPGPPTNQEAGCALYRAAASGCKYGKKKMSFVRSAPEARVICRTLATR